MFNRQPWVCPRCNTVNAPHRDQCTCQPIAITAPAPQPQPVIEPWKPAQPWIVPYSPVHPSGTFGTPFDHWHPNYPYRVTC